MVNPDIILIDLSSIAYPIWHMSQSEPDVNHTSLKIVERVRALANGHKHVAVCCDSGLSFRRDLSATYKANRPEKDERLKHQIKLAIATLKQDGFPIWSVANHEADDIIATATKLAIDRKLTVLICTADKDLLQLVCGDVAVKKVIDGSIVDEEAVGQKFGVRPDQMRDFLTLCGDASDNIAGAKGIGAKKAADLLARFGTLDAVFEGLQTRGPASMGVPPAMASALKEFYQGDFTTTRALVSLKDDLAIPFDELSAERQAQAVADAEEWGGLAADDAPDEEETAPSPDSPPASSVLPFAARTEPTSAAGAVAGPDPVAASSTSHGNANGSPSAIVMHAHPEVLAPAPAEYERQLDPRSMDQAKALALDMYKSQMFSAYGTPHGVLATMMMGRELGLPAMASLRAFHVIEGKHSLSAQAMVALILKSGFAEYFEPIEFDDQHAIFETKRVGARKPVRLEHTIQMAQTAGLLKDKSNWLKVPTDMLVARAQSRLARLVYPDIVGGFYTPDELRDIRDDDKAAAV